MASESAFKIRCLACGAKNRIPQEKAHLTAKCGRCKRPVDTRVLFLPQPEVVSDADFERQVLGSPLPFLLYFWAPWCPSCRSMSPVIDALAKTAKGRLRVGKLNVDQNPQTASRYRVMSVPSILVFDNGRLAETLVGAMGSQDLMMKMARYL